MSYETIRRRAAEWTRQRLWEFGRRFRKSTTISTRQGLFEISFASEDAISHRLYVSHEYELDLTIESLAFLRECGRVPERGKGVLLDVGANNGFISIGMLHTGEMAQAVALEPEPRNFARLQRNLELNGFSSRIVALQVAASDRRATLEFELSESNSGDHRVRGLQGDAGGVQRFGESERQVITVQADRLDSILETLSPATRDRIALVWMDTQGHEGKIFQGASDLMSRTVPVLSEIWPYGIRRSGMAREEFCSIARSYWSQYWMQRNGRFVRYPISNLASLFEELGPDGEFCSVIFTQ